MQKWEYKIITGATERDLNKQGADGWELVAAFQSAVGPPKYIFKRPIQ